MGATASTGASKRAAAPCGISTSTARRTSGIWNGCGTEARRMDCSFAHLDVRSCFSLKEGAFTPEQLVARAVELQMPAVALTDRDGLYGAARFVQACEQAGIRPILGASLTVRAPTPPPGDAHVVLLAEDAV